MKLMIMMIFSIALLTGCGAKSPTDVVTTYFSEIKKGDNAEVEKLLSESMDEELENEDDTDKEENPEIEKAMKNLMKKLDAKVVSEEINEDTAMVEVEVSGVNYSNILLQVFQESFANMFSGVEMTDEEMDNMLLEKMKAAEVEDRTGVVNLTKSDDQWKIETDEDLMGLVLGRADTESKSGF
ncbi:MAG: DUF4878 domain-containing protein [Clostridium sp.]